MKSSIHWCRNIKGERKEVLSSLESSYMSCKDMLFPFSYNIEDANGVGKEPCF
jgi:hypothetical protein